MMALWAAALRVLAAALPVPLRVLREATDAQDGSRVVRVSGNEVTQAGWRSHRRRNAHGAPAQVGEIRSRWRCGGIAGHSVSP